MRIGIIGGGAAGLAAAWLLEQDHDVTLFERDDRLGGHAHTVGIEVDGVTLAVDAGFQFFAPSAAYETFNRLLDALNVRRASYPATLTLARADGTRPVAMPPFRGRRPVWASLTPRALVHLVRFRRFLSSLPAFLAEHDTTVTIAEYVERRRLPASFVDDFLFPLLLAFWCVDLEDFRRFSAYNALYYLGANVPRGLTPPQQSEIPGGLRTYVDALVASLARAEIHAGAPVASVERPPTAPCSWRPPGRGIPSTISCSRATRARRTTCSPRCRRSPRWSRSSRASGTSTRRSRSTATVASCRATGGRGPW